MGSNRLEKIGMTIESGIIKTVLLICVVALLNWASYLPACESTCYKTKGSSVVVDGDTDKARLEAGQMADQAAMDDALAYIGLDSLLANFHLSGNTITLIPFLKLETGEVLKESISRPKEQGAPQIYIAELKIPVCLERKDPMPEFKISVAMNQPAYLDGDEMSFQIRASHDCQYAIFFITEDDGVARLIPSRAKKDNSLKAGQVLVFPSENDIEKGLHLRAHVASPGKSTTETLFALALRETKFETTEPIEEAIYGLYDGQTAHLRDLIRQIAAIPLAHRTEYLVRYAIRPGR